MIAMGLLLALASAVGTNLAFLLKHRGAAQAPAVEGSRPLRSAARLLRSRWFALGVAAEIIAWLLHIGALTLAPLSLTQTVLAGGLVFLGIAGKRFFGFRISGRQWTGLIITSLGLLLIGLTNHLSAYRHYALAALIAIEATFFVAGLLAVVLARHPRLSGNTKGLLLGVASGALFGVSDIALKYLSHVLQGGVLALLSPWTLIALLAAVLTFYVSARSLQLAPGLAVIALTSVAANVVAILGGVLIFHDSLGQGALGIIGHVAAFCMVLVGTALVPAGAAAPVRTEQGPAAALGA